MEKRRRIRAKKQRLEQRIEDWRKDFPSFAKELDVIDKEGNRIPVQQSPILLAFEIARTGRDYVLKPRQVFMTTWELARDLHWLVTRPGSKITILCQSDKDNSAVKAISNRIEVMLGIDESAKQEPEKKFGLLGKYPDLPIIQKSQTHFICGASELHITGAGATEKSANKKGRSGTIHRLHVTEVAFFEYADQTLTAILECVPPHSPNNEIVFESTPLGASGYFYEKYNTSKTGENGYTAHFFQWFKQPEYKAVVLPEEIIEPRSEREKELVALYNITSEQLKWYRQRVADKGQAKVDQEYPTDEQTCWLFDGRLFFDREALSRIRASCKNPVTTKFAGALKIWFPPEAGRSYVIGADPSNGVGGDPVSATVVDDTGRHCASFHGKFTGDEFGEYLAEIGKMYNWALLIVERSASEALVHKTLKIWERAKGDPNAGIGYPNIYVDASDKRLGFKTSGMSRPMILDALEEAVRKPTDKGIFVTFDSEFVNEAFLFIVTDEKPQAAPGAHDDRILSTAVAWSQLRATTGLNYTDFEQAPSIAFENNPVSFEGAPVLQESRGIGLIEDFGYTGGNDLDGF